MSDIDLDKVKETGRKVGLLIEMMKTALELADLSVNDLSELRQYANRVTAVGPIIDPTAYMKLPYSAERDIEKRIEALQAIMRLREHTSRDALGPEYIRAVISPLFIRWRGDVEDEELPSPPPLSEG